MLCLLVKKQLKRKNLREKLHLCRRHKVCYELYTTSYGEICIYKIFYYKDCSKAEKQLRGIIPQRLYTSYDSMPQEYTEKAIVYSLINTLKTNPHKTVCICSENISPEEMCEICRLSKTVYFTGDSLPAYSDEIYRTCGVMPVLTNIPVAADFCLDKNYSFNVILPEELSKICPSEFSHKLFAGLLYKENGRFVF